MIIKTKDAVILTGKVGKDPEEKVVGVNQRKIINLSVSVDSIADENGERKGVWINCYAWDSFLSSLKKGDKVLMAGKREIHDYTTVDGVEKSSEKIKVDFFLKMETGNSNSQENMTLQDSQNLQTFEPVDDDNLPF